MLSAEIDKIGGQTRIRKRVREPVMTMDDDIEGGQMRIRKRVREIETSPENEMAYILPYPFEMDEEDHKKVIKRIGGFRIARVILCNHQKCGKGFWDWSAIAIAKTTIPFLLKKAIMLFTNNTVDIEMIYEALKPLIEVLGKEGIKFMMINSKKGIKWIMKNLQKKVSDIRKKEIKILSKIKNTKKGNGKRGGNITLDEFIMKHHKRLGRGFNESFMNGLLWVNKKILAPIAQTILPPVINTAAAKTFDVIPQYLAERMPGNYEYEDPSKPSRADKAQEKEERFKKYYEATHQKPREAKEEKAPSGTIRTAGKIFDKSKSFWENHLEPLAEPLGEIAVSALADYASGALMGKPSLVGSLIHSNRQAPAPAPAPAPGGAVRAPVRILGRDEDLPIAYPVVKQPKQSKPLIQPSAFTIPGLPHLRAYKGGPPQLMPNVKLIKTDGDVFQGRTLHFNPASHETEMKMPGGQTEMKMPVRERRGTVQYTPEQIQQIQQRTEKLRKGDGKLSSWWKKNKSKILKGLAIGANVGAMAYAGKELYDTHKSAEKDINYKKFMESKPPYSWTEEKGWELLPEIKGGSFWKKHKSKILGTLALGTTLGATALIGKKIRDDIRSQPVLQPASYTIPGYDAHIDRMSQLASGLSPLQWQERKYLDESEFDAPPSTWGSGLCCRACKMKKGKCKKGKGWWSDNKAKILGGISGAATLAGMAYVGNKLYGSKSNEPGNLGQMEYDPSKYSHLDVGYEDV